MSENTQNPEGLPKSGEISPSADTPVVKPDVDTTAGQPEQPAAETPASAGQPDNAAPAEQPAEQPSAEAGDTSAPEQAPAAEQVPASEEAPAAEQAPAADQVPAAEQAAGQQGGEATTGGEAPEAEAAPEEPKQPEYDVDALYAELAEAKGKNETVDVEGIRRVRGGILAEYKHMPLFLPTSHLSLKANPSENDLLSLIHKTFPVHVHELSQDDKSRVIITRRKLLRRELMNEFQVGQQVEGRVSSITDFGAFVDIGGVDGMVHVSRISRRRINHPGDVLKKGDTIKAVIKDIDAGGERISLSMKELEEDSWENVAQEFPSGTRQKGIVRGLTDFGAYVQLKPGVEGLVHISEMSWARRIKHPSELLQEGQEIEVEVLDVSEEKKKISLGYKQTQSNPWDTMADRFAIGSELGATVKEVLPRGVVVTLADDVDAFLPKGKMHPSLKNQKTPFSVGDSVQVLVMDVVPENHSLIVGMEGFDQKAEQGGGGGGRQGGGGGGRQGGGGRRDRDRGDRSGGRGGRDRGDRGGNPTQALGTSSQNVTLLELLSDDEKRKLFGDAAVESEPAPAEEKKERKSEPKAEAAPETPAAEAPAENPPAAETPSEPVQPTEGTEEKGDNAGAGEQSNDSADEKKNDSAAQ